MQPNIAFWDRIAPKYRTSPISDEAAYEATLERVISHLHAEDRMLELGCGTGATALRLAPYVSEMVATDFSAGMIEQAEAREGADAVQFLATDVWDNRFAPGSFDAVAGFNLFHLVSDMEAQFRRVAELLRPGGLFISKTPCLTDPSASLKYRLMVKVIPVMQLFGKAPFVKFHSIKALEGSIEAAGFEIIEMGNYPVNPPSHFVVARKL